jgi:ribulose-phosphate 3-epimerase
LDRVNPNAWLEVDGGISEETLPMLLTAGVDAFVAGNAVFKHENGIAGGLQSLRESIRIAIGTN